MKLSEVKTEGNLKVLLIGSPGAGKTCFAASFPGPILYLDFDNKVDSAALFYRDKPDLLNNIEVRQLSVAFNADPITEFNKLIANELIPAQKSGNFPWKTIVLDSISAFSDAALNHIISTNPGIKGMETKQGKMPDKPHYGVLLREFGRLIPGLLTLPCNIVMCAHVDTYKDDSTGIIIREAMMSGSYSQKLPQAFKEVWFVYVDDKGKRWAQTRADRAFSCLRSQIPGLPTPLPIDNGYSEIAKYL
jgi:Neuraminidase (sialidase)